MTTNKISHPLFLAAILLLLTFLIPAVVWLAETLFPSTPGASLPANLLLAAVLCVWNGQRRAFDLLSASRFWKLAALLVSAAALLFLLLDLQQRPVSTISGQARSSHEIFDVILAGPLLEELIFRGLIWRLLEQRPGRPHSTLLLVITSILFGIMHFGYWLPAGLPLPVKAYTHVLSMVFAGLIFGLLRLKSKSLATPAAAHMLANAVILFFQ